MKKVLLVISCLALLGAAMFTTWYLKVRERNAFYARRYLEYDVSIFSQEAEQKSQERRETYITKLRKIRAQYRADIIKHKDEVRQILSHRDRKHYDKIFAIIPSRPPYKLIDKNSLSYDPSNYGFSWQLFRPLKPDPTIDKFSYAPYLEKGDIPLSESLGAGRKTLTLWVSGRVTETTMTDNPALQIRPLKGPTPAFINVDEEIDPAFDFLKP